MPASTMPKIAEHPSGVLLDACCIGLPDAVTALWCLWVWAYPLALGADAVAGVVLMLLLEFILLNATGFFTVIPFMFALGSRTRSGILIGLCGLYLILVVTFAKPFHAIWPYFVFAWMAASKLLWMHRNRRASRTEQMWLIAGWAVAVLVYLGAVGVGATLDMPQLGITTNVLPFLHLPGGGEWVDEPHRAVASATFYFTMLALYKTMYFYVRRCRQGRQRGTPADSALHGSFGTP